MRPGTVTDLGQGRGLPKTARSTGPAYGVQRERHDQRGCSHHGAAPRSGRRRGEHAVGGQLRDHRTLRASERSRGHDRRGNGTGNDVPRLGVRRAGCAGVGCNRRRRWNSLLCLRPRPAPDARLRHVRALQTGLEDYLLHRRIELLREYYFREAPELREYLVSVPPTVFAPGSLLAGRRQVFRSVAGMVGVITAVLAGATASLIAIAASSHSLTAALVSGIVVGLATVIVLMRFQESAFLRTVTTRLLADFDSEQTPSQARGR
jgi:hypothetical protein